jgi:cytochrome P450
MKAFDNSIRPVPAHVPQALVYDYDHMSDARLSPDAHAGCAAIAAEAPPIFFTPRYCGHWVATSYADVTALARDIQHLSTRRYNLFGVDEPLVVFPMMLDPPEHTRFRAPLTDAFKPQSVLPLEPQIREEAAQIVAGIRDRRHCNFIEDVAEQLPMRIFMRMVGMPLDKYDQFKRWVVRFFRTTDEAERYQIYQGVWDAMTVCIEQRMLTRQNDVISKLIDSDVGGRTPTKEELQRYSMQLFFGGLDTLVHGLSHSFSRLAREPELQAKLVASPELVPNAADELLRLYGVTTPLRLVIQDFDYQGVPFRKGDMLLIHLPAANLDPEAFENPHCVEFGRNKRNVTFNTGPHMCPGAFISKLELQILLEEWLKQIPSFSPDPDDPPSQHAGLVYAMDRLPLRW